MKFKILILHQLRLDSRTWKFMIFCFSLSIAASNFQTKSYICPAYSPSWFWWPIWAAPNCWMRSPTLNQSRTVDICINEVLREGFKNLINYFRGIFCEWGGGRNPPSVKIIIFFKCSENVQNALKNEIKP